MSDSSWCCRECDAVNDWGDAVCEQCGARLYDLAAEMGLLRVPAGEIERLRADLAEKEKPCIWTEDENGTYFTACGQAWCFECDGVEENGVKFCPFCGHPVEVSDE